MLCTTQRRQFETWAPVGQVGVKQDYYVSRPMPTETADYWSPAVDPDGVVRDRFSEQERAQFIADRKQELDFIWSKLPKSILDFGSGPGWLLEACPDGSRKIAVESSQIAGEIILSSDIHLAESLSEVADCCCDMAVAYHVIEHLQFPIEAICQLRRILEPGGWLILGTPDFHSPCAVRFGDNYRMLHDQTHVSLFTLESMHRFLRDNGFIIHDVRFPFPDRYATQANFTRWADTSRVSPPWPGNWMTFYCTRSNGGK